MASRQQISQALELSEPTEEEVKGAALVTMVEQALDNQTSAFRAVLPSTTDPERFAGLVMTAVTQTPKLAQCFTTRQGQTSLLVSAMQAAALGLEPNTLAEEAWLIPSDNKGPDGVKRMEARLDIGYKGYMKLARESREILKIAARVVYQGDEFDYVYGTEEKLVHRPATEEQRGDLLYAYAVAWPANGGEPMFEVLDQGAVHKRRAHSQSWKNTKSRPYSPWTTNTDAMWRKSAVKALAHYLPRTPKLVSALGSDGAQLEMQDSGIITPVSRHLGPGDDGDIDVPDEADDTGDDGDIVETNAYALIDLAKAHGLIPENASAGGARQALLTFAKDADLGNGWGNNADAMAAEVGPKVAEFIRKGGKK